MTIHLKLRYIFITASAKFARPWLSRRIAAVADSLWVPCCLCTLYGIPWALDLSDPSVLSDPCISGSVVPFRPYSNFHHRCGDLVI